MCYAIPGKLTAVKKGFVTLSYFGEKRNAINELHDLKPGDFVYAQGGFVIEKIPQKDALVILETWEDRFIALQKKDASLQSPMPKDKRSGNKVREILKRQVRGIPLSKKELLQLLQATNEQDISLMMNVANKIRQKQLKNACCIHGIIEFSNYCRNNCHYCGIRLSNAQLQRYRMSIDEIVTTATHAVNTLGFKALVLQSGEDLGYADDDLAQIIKRIRKACNVLLFISVGSRSLSCYEKMYEAGARGILLRFETSNRKLYRKMHEGHKADFAMRIKTLKATKKMGYLTATGALIGLPGQTPADIIDDILFTRSLRPDMYTFGPLIPAPGTPLAHMQEIDSLFMAKVIGCCRITDPKAKIVVTTALETLDPREGRKKGLLAGGNSLMINLTPPGYREKYAIYAHRHEYQTDIKTTIARTLELLQSLGRAPTDLGIEKAS